MRTIIKAILAVLATPVLGLVSVLPQTQTEEGPVVDQTATVLIITAATSWTATLGGIWWLAMSFGG